MQQKIERAKSVKRVVVTGMGMISPIGVGLQQSWENLLKNQKGIVSQEDKRTLHQIKNRFGAVLPNEVGSREFMHEHALKMNVPHQTIPNAIIKEVMAHSKLLNKDKQLNMDGYRIGLNFAQIVDPNEQSFYIDTLLLNQHLSIQGFLIAGTLSLEYGLNGIPGVNDISSGGSQLLLMDAYRMIKDGYQDAMLVGGYDRNVLTFYHKQLESLGLLVKNKKQAPGGMLKPFDSEGDGSVMGDGGAIMVVESEENALKRGANIICEVAGVGQGIGAHTQFIPSAKAIQKCLIEVLHEAGWSPSEVDFLNGSGSGFKDEDVLELEAIKRVLGSKKEDLEQKKVSDEGKLDLSQAKNVAINSFKGNIGHWGIVSGIGESVLAVKAMQEGTIPGTANLKTPIDPDLNLLTEGQTVSKPIEKVVKLSFGHGINVSATAFQKYVQ